MGFNQFNFEAHYSLVLSATDHHLMTFSLSDPKQRGKLSLSVVLLKYQRAAHATATPPPSSSSSHHTLTVQDYYFTPKHSVSEDGDDVIVTRTAHPAVREHFMNCQLVRDNIKVGTPALVDPATASIIGDATQIHHHARRGEPEPPPAFPPPRWRLKAPKPLPRRRLLRLYYI